MTSARGPMRQINAACMLVCCCSAISFAQSPQPQYPNYPSETPEHFEVNPSSWDYTRRTVDIPMRDGVKLHTVILIPKGAQHAPILMTRTPYDADALTSHAASSRLGPIL